MKELLPALLALLTSLLASCGESTKAEKTDLVYLLAMKSGDRVTELYVTRVLGAHGIHSVTQGSIGWSTSVPANRRAEAERLLRAEAPLRGFVIWLPSGEIDSGLEAPSTSLSIDREFADALSIYPEDSDVGRILRSDELQAEMRGAEHVRVLSVSFHRRDLVTKDLRPAKAVAARVSIVDGEKFSSPIAADVLLLDPDAK